MIFKELKNLCDDPVQQKEAEVPVQSEPHKDFMSRHSYNQLVALGLLCDEVLGLSEQFPKVKRKIYS